MDLSRLIVGIAIGVAVALLIVLVLRDKQREKQTATDTSQENASLVSAIHESQVATHKALVQQQRHFAQWMNVHAAASAAKPIPKAKPPAPEPEAEFPICWDIIPED